MGRGDGAEYGAASPPALTARPSVTPAAVPGRLGR
jgi:hypothetical protein